MTNDDRSNQDRTGDGQAPSWGGAPQQQPAAEAPRYGERSDSTPQYGQPAPRYGEQQDQYGQQQYGQQPYAAAPASSGSPAWQSYEEPKAKKKTLGVVAFVVGLAALVVGVIGGYLFGQAFGGSEAFRDSMENSGATPSDSQITELMTSSAAVTGSLMFYLGTALGLWAIVQGIIAAVTKRGRAWGVVAIILAVVAVIAFGIAIGFAAVAASGMS
ncbi:hypothetical protein EDF63_0996 [Curtobacterium sp. JUb34]|uniref:DUF4064 domain-containing protein n=1 Tax=Curtobacterium sp. JUb34 TaxID=2485109 RepID=UPI000F4918E1|nr:DUF4064 domain-containing protein [Curtobacterium sp. JUb34]ROR36864.1 hypothetical protein EDF63_0996 [Curtobacterium sp. JUb34]